LCVKERPDVLVFQHLSTFVSTVFVFMAFAQILRATRPITAYSGSTPFEKKNDKVQNH
jgi:hypothetical protein